MLGVGLEYFLRRFVPFIFFFLFYRSTCLIVLFFLAPANLNHFNYAWCLLFPLKLHLLLSRLQSCVRVSSLAGEK